MKIKKRENKGITLIALVVTIIVLLILAGVLISMLTGENGILKRANEAKEETARATEDEQRKMAMFEAAMNKENTEFQGVTIPAGFAPTRIAGESTVEEGLVITDSEGNEFVWVPVINGDEYKKNEKYLNEVLSLNSEDDEGYLPDGVMNEKETVLNVGGFYVGRFEAGAEGGKLQSNEEDNYSWTIKPKLVCKKGMTVYNWISQDDTKKVAKTFVNNNNVKSSLLSGTQWDVMMATINGKIDGTGKKFDVTVYDSRRHTRKYKQNWEK